MIHAKSNHGTIMEGLPVFSGLDGSQVCFRQCNLHYILKKPGPGSANHINELLLCSAVEGQNKNIVFTSGAAEKTTSAGEAAQRALSSAETFGNTDWLTENIYTN
jgi:hypothetical protein